MGGCKGVEVEEEEWRLVRHSETAERINRSVVFKCSFRVKLVGYSESVSKCELLGGLIVMMMVVIIMRW